MSHSTTVLVTGANGFLGAATVLELLTRGYKVKGVVRSQDKADAFIRQYPQFKANLKFAIIPSLTDEAGYLAATLDVDYIIHTASPFSFSFKDNLKDCLEPAVEGTRVVLRVADKRPAIKHVVITSSHAAVGSPLVGLGAGITYTENDWNPTTWEEAVSSPDTGFVYCASKEFGERAAWEFIRHKEPHFSITTFCPPWIFGPPMQPIESMDRLNESGAYIWEMLSKGTDEIPATIFPLMIDVRDLAKLQVDALTNPKAKNQRYLASSDGAWNEDIVYTFKEAYPELASRAAKGQYRKPEPHYEQDCSKTERDFDIEWTPLKKTIVDMAAVLFAKEKELAGKTKVDVLQKQPQ
ncbi:NAD-P-binding protein [Calocera viscosa TUFC12733]|uniref:NAD-P-binding protein n=1 Tax=Calocera viscosa (strain TUFC12733) TaxID=1330018 RepID=A0A167JW41_CALVF|nr:NAD-P-binding protein [Calocera viscosa TUFC12733]